MSLEIDHVLIAVADLDVAGLELAEQHRLSSVDGGRHPGWGTANRIVPLGDAYLELVAVVDPVEAAQNTFGSWVAASDGPFGWAVRTDELDEVAARLGLAVRAGSRRRSDGRLLQWRMAGVEEAAAEPSLPFFIEWAPGTDLPGGAPAAVGIEELQLTGDAGRLDEWLVGERLPLDVQPGDSAVAGVVLTSGIRLSRPDV